GGVEADGLVDAGEGGGGGRVVLRRGGEVRRVAPRRLLEPREDGRTALEEAADRAGRAREQGAPARRAAVPPEAVGLVAEEGHVLLLVDGEEAPGGRIAHEPELDAVDHHRLDEEL